MESLTMPVFAPTFARRREEDAGLSPLASPALSALFAPSSISRATLDGHGHGHGSPSPLSAVFPASLLLSLPPSSSPPSSSADSASAASQAAQAQGAGAQPQDDPHAAPSSYITHGALGGIGAVLLRALKAGMPVWERGGDVRLLGGEFVFEWG
jgi:hypothetical protein